MCADCVRACLVRLDTFPAHFFLHKFSNDLVFPGKHCGNHGVQMRPNICAERRVWLRLFSCLNPAPVWQSSDAVIVAMVTGGLITPEGILAMTVKSIFFFKLQVNWFKTQRSNIYCLPFAWHDRAETSFQMFCPKPGPSSRAQVAHRSNLTALALPPALPPFHHSHEDSFKHSFITAERASL